MQFEKIIFIKSKNLSLLVATYDLKIIFSKSKNRRETEVPRIEGSEDIPNERPQNEKKNLSIQRVNPRSNGNAR